MAEHTNTNREGTRRGFLSGEDTYLVSALVAAWLLGMSMTLMEVASSGTTVTLVVASLAMTVGFVVLIKRERRRGTDDAAPARVK